MALGPITSIVDGGFGTTGPLSAELINIVGDSAYPTGGTTGFQAKVRALYKSSWEVMAVIPQDCAGYQPCYDKANDKLKVFALNGSEVADTTNLSAVNFKVLLLLKLALPGFAPRSCFPLQPTRERAEPMAAIPKDFGVGGSNISPSGANGEPTLAQALRDIADDFAKVGAATIASDISSPAANDLPSAITLVNEIRTKLKASFAAQNALGALKTTKA